MTTRSWAHNSSNSVPTHPQRTAMGVSPIYLACLNGNATLVSALLDAGADPNSRVSGGETVLMTASRCGSVETVDALINSGAQINAKERNDQTAAMWAAAEGHVEVIKSLLKAGADFDTFLSNVLASPLSSSPSAREKPK